MQGAAVVPAAGTAVAEPVQGLAVVAGTAVGWGHALPMQAVEEPGTVAEPVLAGAGTAAAEAVAVPARAAVH